MGRETLHGVEARVRVTPSWGEWSLWSTLYDPLLITGALRIPTPYVARVAGGSQWLVQHGRTSLSLITRSMGRGSVYRRPAGSTLRTARCDARRCRDHPRRAAHACDASSGIAHHLVCRQCHRRGLAIRARFSLARTHLGACHHPSPADSLMSVLTSFNKTIASAVALSTTAAMIGCADESVTNNVLPPATGIVVLDGFIQPGLTLVADTGTTTTRIAFASGAEFDAGEFTLERDTVLSVSSRAAGDLLYVADLRAGSVRRLQMPAGSNPSRARLLRSSVGESLIGVALRDSGAVAFVSVRGSGTPVITRLSGVGTCPTDVFQYDNATWVVDANANCRVNYNVLGDVRLIRVSGNGAARDTLVLPGMRGSAASAIIDGDVAYVSAGGDANFASFPYTLLASGSVARIDLRNRRMLTQRAMPSNSYGAHTRLGADGFLYVSSYKDLSAFEDGIVKLRTSDLSFVSGASAPWLALKSANGDATSCGSATADVLGRVHCIVSGFGSTTSLLVFDASGRETRRVAAGQGGVDLALR